MAKEDDTVQSTDGENAKGPKSANADNDGKENEEGNVDSKVALVNQPAFLANTPHKLESEWSWWEHRAPVAGKSYEDNMHKLCDFGSIEDFWNLYNNIPKPSEIFYDGQCKKRFSDRSIESMSVFKKGIKPEWEDVANRSGAEWFCRKSMEPGKLDEFWLHMVLGMIGETMDPGDEITGARVVDKSNGKRVLYRLELWFRKKDMGTADKLKDKLIACLGNGGPSFQYRAHTM